MHKKWIGNVALHSVRTPRHCGTRTSSRTVSDPSLAAFVGRSHDTTPKRRFLDQPVDKTRGPQLRRLVCCLLLRALLHPYPTRAMGPLPLRPQFPIQSAPLPPFRGASAHVLSDWYFVIRCRPFQGNRHSLNLSCVLDDQFCRQSIPSYRQFTTGCHVFPGD